MAITTPRYTLEHLLQAPDAGPFSAPVAQTSIAPNAFPDRLRGLGLEHSLVTLKETISDHLWEEYHGDAVWRDHVKKTLAHQLAEAIVEKITFTTAADHYTMSHMIYGRVAVLTPQQFKKLLEAVC